MKDIVSKALTDNKISHEEFLLIKSEVDKYHEMKKSIRRKYQSEKTEQVKEARPTAEGMKRIETYETRQRRALISLNCFTVVVGGSASAHESELPPAYNPDF